jgi:putative transposase
VSTERFSTGKQFHWQGATYEVKRLLPGSDLNVANMCSGEMRTVPVGQLVEALFADELHFAGESRRSKPELKSDYIDLSDCPQALRAVAEYRLEVIRPLLALPPCEHKKAIEARVRRFEEQRQAAASDLDMAISAASIYRWIADYTKSGGDIRVLIPDTEKRGGKQKSRLKAEVEAVVKAAISDLCAKRERRTVDYVHREIAVRIDEENRHRPTGDHLKLPSRATIGRRIAAFDVVERGGRAAEQELMQYEAIEYPTIPLERVEIDHTRSDIVVIDETDFLPLGRLTLTYCLDTATRYPLGYYLGFEPPSYYTVMECLYCGIWPKGDVQGKYGTEHAWLAYGVPYMLAIDNGKEFVGRDLEDACHLLGILLERTPIKTPRFKAAVERMFGTLNTGLLHTLPGTTFSNLWQRGDYDSLKQACINLNDLDRMMHIFLVDIYAEDFHQGLEGIPARVWEEATRNGFFPRLPSSAEELRILLGRVAFRTVQPYGIEFESLRYNCPELAPLRARMRRQDDRRIKIKYHPSDVSRVWVYDAFDRQYIEVPALAQEYTQGLSLWKHRVIRNFVLDQQDRVDIVALGRAQRRIQEIVEASLKRKRLGTRARIARWQASGSHSEPTEEAKPGTASPAEGEGLGPTVSPPLDLDLERLEREGWSVSYGLPRQVEE